MVECTMELMCTRKIGDEYYSACSTCQIDINKLVGECSTFLAIGSDQTVLCTICMLIEYAPPHVWSEQLMPVVHTASALFFGGNKLSPTSSTSFLVSMHRLPKILEHGVNSIRTSVHGIVPPF